MHWVLEEEFVNQKFNRFLIKPNFIDCHCTRPAARVFSTLLLESVIFGRTVLFLVLLLGDRVLFCYPGHPWICCVSQYGTNQLMPFLLPSKRWNYRNNLPGTESLFYSQMCPGCFLSYQFSGSILNKHCFFLMELREASLIWETG